MTRAILIGEHEGQARAWLLAHGIDDLVTPAGAEIALLGTGGAIAAHAASAGEGAVIMLRGVAPEAFDLSSLLRAHDSAEAAVTVALFAREKATLLGWSGAAAEMDRSGRILRWSPKGDFDRDLNWIDAGVFVLAPAVLKRIPSGTPFDLVRQLVPLCLRSQLVVRGYAVGSKVLPSAPTRQPLSR